MEIYISLFSLCIASIALGWNIYKDVIQKPRLKASFAISEIYTYPHFEKNEPLIIFSGVNLGPGDIVIKNVILKSKKNDKFFVPLINMNWTKLPQKISPGEEAQIYIDYKKNCFLSINFHKAAIVDSFGRRHWVSEKDIKKSKQQYHKDFGAE